MNRDEGSYQLSHAYDRYVPFCRRFVAGLSKVDCRRLGRLCRKWVIIVASVYGASEAGQVQRKESSPVTDQRFTAVPRNQQNYSYKHRL